MRGQLLTECAGLSVKYAEYGKKASPVFKLAHPVGKRSLAEPSGKHTEDLRRMDRHHAVPELRN